MENKNVVISFSTATVLKIIAILLVCFFAYIIRDILLLIFVSLILAALIEPPTNYLERFKIPRSLSVGVIYIVLILFSVFIVQLLIPPMLEQLSYLTAAFPSLWSQLVSNFSSFQQFSQTPGVSGNIQQWLSDTQTNLTQAASGAYSIVLTTFSNLLDFLIILVIAFYLVVEKDSLSKLLRALAPASSHTYLTKLTLEIQNKIGAWARGQLILSIVTTLLALIGLMIFLPQYALVLSLVAGVTAIVPYLGQVAGAVPAVFLAFTAGNFSVSRGFGVLIFYIIINFLIGNFVAPKVMEKQVGLHPVVIVVAMLIGARLAGVTGLVLAIPVATSIGVVVKDFFNQAEFTTIADDSVNPSW